jgi:hypothetical protein
MQVTQPYRKAPVKGAFCSGAESGARSGVSHHLLRGKGCLDQPDLPFNIASSCMSRTNLPELIGEPYPDHPHGLQHSG